MIIDIISNDEWKPVKGYEGRYLINTNGEVKSLQKRYYNQIIKPRNSVDGYSMVTLCNGKNRTYYVHRLVADNFLLNSIHRMEVNHINGNKQDNRLENLEVVTHKENIQHAYKMGLIPPGRRSAKVVDICTGQKFNSIKEASKVLSINYNTCRNMLSGRNKNHSCLQYVA